MNHELKQLLPQEDRRESPRVPMRFLVRDPSAGSSYQEHEGLLSLAGFAWPASEPPGGSDVEVRFSLGDGPEIEAKGEIVREIEDSPSQKFHVLFTELDLQTELAIARYLDERRGRG